MNIYHIAYVPGVKTVHLHFWGCNLSCRACFKKYEITDLLFTEIKDATFKISKKAQESPNRFLDLEEVKRIVKGIDIARVIFMGAEPAIDPELPELAKALHDEFHTYNILLTNGFKLIDLDHIEEVVFSLKAYTSNLHRHYTGRSNRKALANFVSLYKSGVKLRAESIFIPEYIDCPEIERIAQFIAGVDKNIPYRIDGYIPVGDNPWRRPISNETERAVGIARKYLLNVSCLTGSEDLKFEVWKVF